MAWNKETRRIHNVLGLIFGPVLLITSLSGSILAYISYIEPHILALSIQNQTPKPSISLARAFSQLNDQKQKIGEPTSILFLSKLQEGHIYLKSTDDSCSTFKVTFSTVNGIINKVNCYDHEVSNVLYRLHSSLLLADLGRKVLLSISVALLLLLLSSLYFLLFKRIKNPSRNRTHKYIALFLLLPLTNVCVSSILLNINHIRNISDNPSTVSNNTQGNKIDYKTIGLETSKALNATLSRKSGYTPEYILFPQSGSILTIKLSRKENYFQIQIDPRTNEIISSELEPNKPEEISLYKIHNGSIFGLFGNVIMVIAGLGLPILVFTGTVQFLRRKDIVRL